MGKRAFSVNTMTPTATADTTNLANQTHMSILGATAIQRTKISEVYMGGQAAASSPMYMLLARNSQVGATPTISSGFDAALDPAMAAAALCTPYNNAVTTFPQRSATLHLLNLTFNAFGGIVRWVAAPDEEVQIVGSTASLGDVSLSQVTGGTSAAIGAHIVYETV